MPLSVLDLVSTFFGRVSFGFSLWFAIPQIGLLYTAKPTSGGPRFTFLLMWLIGDVAQTVGLFAMGGLATQQASGICFAVSSSIIMLQRCYYRGLVPFTKYRSRRRDEREREREHPVLRQLVAGIHRPPAYTSLMLRSGTTQDNSRDESARRRDEPRREKRSVINRNYERTSDRRSTIRFIDGQSLERWKDFDGMSFNLTGFCVVTTVMLVVWGFVDVKSRDSNELRVEVLPVKHSERLGWYLGWIGTLLYTAPRLYQLGCIVVEKSVSAISAFSFASLVLQNVTMLISILAVSHTPETALAQAPYLTNVACALLADVFFLVLYRLYRDNPTRPPRPWSDPDWMYRDSPIRSPRSSKSPPCSSSKPGPLSSSRGIREEEEEEQEQKEQDRRKVLLRQRYDDDLVHARLLPPVPTSSREYRPLPPRQLGVRRALERTQLRHELERSESVAIKAEKQWVEGANAVPWGFKGRRADELDREEARQVRLFERLKALTSATAAAVKDDDDDDEISFDEEEKREQFEWEKARRRRVRQLEELRTKRTEMGYSNRAKRQGGGRGRGPELPGRDTSMSLSSEEPDSSSSSSSSSRSRSERRFTLSRAPSVARNVVGHRGKKDPRRGVGTGSEEEIE